MMHTHFGPYGRYTLISLATGCVDYLFALAPLRLGEPPSVSLAAAIVVAGVIDYFALEKWGYAGRRGGFSWKRLFQSGLVEAGTYCIRLGALTAWRRYTPAADVVDHALGLGVAFLGGFVFGYLVRSRIVFAAK